MTEPPRPTTILVVDDEPAMIELTRAILEPLGYQLFGVRDPARALDMVVELNPDLVLLDVAMPGLSGFETCRRILASTRARVVMVTAHARADDRARGMEAGAVEYLAKPFRASELVQVVERALAPS